MTVKIINAVRVAGTLRATGSIVDDADLSYSEQSALVSRGDAQWWGEDAQPRRGARRERIPNLLVVAGDSFNAQTWNDTATYDYKNADGIVTWALALSRQRMSLAAVVAKGNSRISAEAGAPGVKLINQINQAIDTRASHLFLMMGANDTIAGFSLRQIIVAYEEALQRACDAGLTVWLGTQPTMNSAFGSYSVANQGRMFGLNDWVRQRGATTWMPYGVIPVDIAAACVDPASATGDWKSNGSQDGLHPRNVGAYWGGKELARLWTAMLPEAPMLVSSNADNYAYSPLCQNLLANGMFQAGTPLATGFTGTAIAGGLSTNSIVARSDGFGNHQRMVQTSAAANDGYRLQSGSVHANGLQAGDLVQAEYEVTIGSMTNCFGEELQLVANGTTSKGSWDGYIDTTNDTALPEGYTAVRRSPWVRIEGAPASVYARCNTYYSGAGGATVDVSRMTLRKLGGW